MFEQKNIAKKLDSAQQRGKAAFIQVCIKNKEITYTARNL